MSAMKLLSPVPLQSLKPPNTAVRIHWTRALLLTFLVALSLLWFRDVVRLSSLHQVVNPDLVDSSIHRWNTKPVITPAPSDLSVSAKDPCERWPNEWLEKVQVVLKTGVAEDPTRVQTWVNSVGRCISNILIVGDHKGSLGDREIHDVLALLPESYRDTEASPDFAVYEEQNRLIDEGKLEEHNTESGWRLDRYKFLPMVSFARRMNLHAEWYFFVETDTYVSWDNLYRFLGQFDPQTPLYIGSPLHGATDDSWFAYGGSGIALSAAAMSKLLARKAREDGSYKEPEIYGRKQWIDTLRYDTYGESVLGTALRVAEVGLSGYYPMFYPLNLASIPFGDTEDAGFWCEPVITLHKLWSSAEYEGLSTWEMGRDNHKPLVFRDLFRYINPHKPSWREDWDNLSPHLSSNISAHHSPEYCRDACAANDTCLQFKYHDHRCMVSSTVSLGGPRPPEGFEITPEEMKFESGWMFGRVEQWYGRPNSTCEQVRWLRHSVDRRWS